VRVGLVGCGRIGRTHLEAWSAMGVEVLGIADPAATDHPGAFASAAGLLDAVGASLEVVVVATPTPTHAAVIGDLRRLGWGGRVVVEKPAASTAAEARHVLADDGVDLVYHAAFAPEVTWCTERLAAWAADHGDVVAAEQWLGDAYAADLARAEAVLGSSWLDSGINGLSILARLLGGGAMARRSLRPVPSTTSGFEAEVDVAVGDRSVVATVVTAWGAAEPSKSTRLHLEDGAVVVLDHQAITGRLIAGAGRTAEVFESPGPPRRLVQHYLGCFARLLVEGRRSFPREVDVRLHEVLLER
jgi:hypothetical protein